MKKQLLLLMMIMLPMVASADDSGTCGDNVSWTYTEETQALTISGNGEMTDFSLKKIPWKTYSKDIKVVKIEDGVTHIGSASFYDCENLISVDIPQSVNSFGGRPFGNCKSLISITIPSNLTYVGAYAFDNCSSLKKVIISNMSAWCKIKFEDNVSNPLTWAGYLYLNDELIENLIIPADITSIGNYNFTGCKGITSVTIHNGVTSIGESCFRNCENIATINLPNGISYVGSSAFAGCISLKTIEIPNSISVINEGLFLNCTGLTDVTIPTSVTSIEQAAFNGCKNLKSINIPYGINSIKYGTFHSCTSLSEVTIPTSLMSIDDWAFYNCKLLGSVKLPEGLKSIGKSAFRDCKNLQTLELPSTLESINQLAFSNCKLLFQINIFATIPPSLYDDTFSIYSATVKVPKGCKERYTSASVWSNFAKIIDAYNYNLTYLVDNEIYKTYEIEEGSAISPEPAPTKEGYTFSGWSEIPATMPAHDVTVTGTFSINKYKLTYTVDGEEYKTYEVEYGAIITPEAAPTKEGYTFSGWSEIPETMPAKDVMVTGTFSINKYKLTYTVDGAEYKTYEVEYGATITPEAEPTKEGYTFGGWSKIPETMPAHDLTVTGTFTINKYKLTYTVDGEDYKSYEVEYGATITPEAEPTKEGYTFSGWSEIPETMPAHDVTVTGTFTKGAYKLTYYVDGEVYKTVSYDYGETITPEAEPTKEGYTFSGWSEIPETMPAHDVTVTGAFSINKYKLTYTVDGAEYKTYEIEYNATITAEAEPTKEGYTFSGWSEIPSTMPPYDVTVTGSFNINSYKLTYMIDEKVYKETMYEYGATIIAEPQPEGDYATFEWTDLPQTMPAHDVVVYASYTSEIIEVLIASQNYVRIYSPNGKKLNKLQKGLNIVILNDGTVKKIVIK